MLGYPSFRNGPLYAGLEKRSIEDSGKSEVRVPSIPTALAAWRIVLQEPKILAFFWNEKLFRPCIPRISEQAQWYWSPKEKQFELPTRRTNI